VCYNFLRCNTLKIAEVNLKMHMADALISPAVGGVMWAATAGAAAYSGKVVHQELSEDKVPLMGVLGAFIFAAQMINFAIPGTGSSGHLGGGMILAILLGPAAGFLTMASILIIQALFFADGGLLALGCNIFNMGFFTCFLAYPLIYRPIVRQGATQGRIITGSLLAAIVGLQLGALGVVIETVASGLTNLPFSTFAMIMQPIHLAIGVVEGLITAAVITFLGKARPEMLRNSSGPAARRSFRPVIVTLMVIALFTAGVLAWFASADPDGLEWSLARATGKEELRTSSPVHDWLGKLQEKIAFLPDYGFKPAPEKPEAQAGPARGTHIDGGTSVAGLVGALFTLGLAFALGFGLKRFAKRSGEPD
jgi:cobalt/nickel transport system permease protein